MSKITVFDSMVSDAISIITQKMDNVIREVLKEHNVPTPEEGKLTELNLDMYNNGLRILTYKGKPILEFHEIETINDGNKITLTQKFRKL